MVIFFSCEKEEWNNPLDPNSDVSPDEWAPKNLMTEQIDITKVKLTWKQDEKRIEGFKIDRKFGSSAWQNEYALIEKDTKEWIDTLAVPDSLNIYRLYAYAGDRNSSVIEKNVNPVFPAPTNLQLQQLTLKEIKLTWQDNSSGEEGFMIDRKVGNGAWVVSYGVVEENTECWIDTSAVLDEMNYYRLYAYVKGINTSKIEKNLNHAIPAPNNLQIRQLSDVELKLSWRDNSIGEEGFKIDRKVGANDLTDCYGATEADITEWNDNAPVFGEVNYYRIYAYLGEKKSSSIEGNIENIIQAPTNISSEAVNDQTISLSWNDNCTFEEGFKIERKENGGNFIELVILGKNVTSYNDKGLIYGKTYVYRVFAFTDLNNSDYSVEISAETIFPEPSNLTAIPISDSDVKLDWRDNCTFESGFQIERKTGTGSFQQIAEVSANVKTYTDENLIYGETYIYRVKAYTLINNSAYSNEKSIQVIISTPGNLTATQVSDTGVKLDWQDSCTFESGFRIERKTGTGSFQQIVEVGSNVTSYTDNNLSVDFSYTFRALAFTQTNQSAYSNEVGIEWGFIQFLTLSGHNGYVSSVAFSPDGSLIASGSWDNTIKIWRVSDGSLMLTLSGHSDDVCSVVFSPDGSLLASGSSDETIKIWRVSDGSLVRTLSEGTPNITKVAFSPDGSLIASGIYKTIKLWRVSNGSLVRTLSGHSSMVNSVAFSPDGSLLASGSNDETIRICRVSDGSLVRTISEYEYYIYTLAFSPDGVLIASGSVCGTPKVWRVIDGSIVQTCIGSNNWVTSVAFSSDGLLLASGGEKSINIWQVSDWSLVSTTNPPSNLTVYQQSSYFHNIAFSPDISLMASSIDKTIILWKRGWTLVP